MLYNKLKHLLTGSKYPIFGVGSRSPDGLALFTSELRLMFLVELSPMKDLTDTCVLVGCSVVIWLCGIVPVISFVI